MPGGAFPSYAHGYYPRTNSLLQAWDAISRERDTFLAWMKTNVLDKGPEVFAEHVRKFRDGGGVRTIMADYKPNEMMTIAAARALKNDDVCFVGIGMPSAACNLARLTHAPQITLIYESGTLGTKPDILPLSIGDGELCETALTTVPVPEMFRYWLQGGRINVGFLGGAQIDKYANLNTTVVGGPTTSRRCGCPAAAARRRSPLPAAKSSSSWRRASAALSTSSISSPRSAMGRAATAAPSSALRPRARRGSSPTSLCSSRIPRPRR